MASDSTVTKNDTRKTKAQLSSELKVLYQRVQKLEWNQMQKEQDKSAAHLVSAQSIVHLTSVDWDLRPVRENGEVRTMHDRFEEICNGAGTPVELIGATKDITEYRK